MNQISYYDVNGKYVWTGSPTIIIPGMPLPPINNWEIGTFIYSGPVNAGTQYHDRLTNSPVSMGERPSMIHVFDFVNKEWIDPRNVSQLAAAKWEEIKVARQAAIDAPLITPFGVFDANTAKGDQLNITNAVLLANNLTAMGFPVEIEFTLYDNTVLILDAPMAIQVGLLLGAQIKAARNRATALRDLIFSDNITPADLAAITWAENV